MYTLATQTGLRNLAARASVLSFTVADATAMADIVLAVGSASNGLAAASIFELTIEVYIGGVSVLPTDQIIEVQASRQRVLLYFDPIPIASGDLVEVFVTSSAAADSSVSVTATLRDTQAIQPTTRGRRVATDTDGAVNLSANAISSVSGAAATATASSISSLAAARVVVPVNALPFEATRVPASKVLIRKRSSFTYTLNDVGELTGVDEIYFTIKDNRDLDNDSSSLLQVKLSIPASSGTDGIQFIGRSAAGANRTSGSIAVQNYTEGNTSKKRIVVAVADDATALIPTESDGTFDIKVIVGSDSEILDEGKAVVREVTTWQTSS